MRFATSRLIRQRVKGNPARGRSREDRSRWNTQPSCVRRLSSRDEGLFQRRNRKGSGSRDRRLHRDDPPIIDPDYALAYAGRSFVLGHLAFNQETPRTAIRVSSLDKAQADARKAIALAPGLAEGHLALASYFAGSLDFSRAIEEFERALALAPGSTRVLRDYGSFAVAMGRTDFGLTSLRRAVVLDPLNVLSHGFLGEALLKSEAL